MAVEYTEAFETDLRDMEDCSIHLALCDVHGQVDPAEERYLVACIDHLANTYAVSADELVLHSEELARLWRNYEEHRAERYTETLKELFRDTVCVDYSPTY